MNEKCTRCGGPAAEAPKGKGYVNKCRIKRLATQVHSVFNFQMWRFTPWTEDPADQIRMTYTEFILCNPCAGDVFTYANTKIPQKEAQP